MLKATHIGNVVRREWLSSEAFPVAPATGRRRSPQGCRHDETTSSASRSIQLLNFGQWTTDQ
jgi:hypothetical protein